MKRLLVVALSALSLLAMAGCGPGINPNIEEATGYELLFELPMGCTLVSETFALTTEDTGFSGNYHAEAMLITATYVIENDGTAIAMSALQPAPMARSALNYLVGLYYDLRQDGEIVNSLWVLRETPASWHTTYASVSAGMATTTDFDLGIPIYRHTFRGPNYGQSAFVSVVGTGRLVYEDPADVNANVLSIPASDDPDDYVFYSLGEASTFTFDYDAGLLTESISFDEMIAEIVHDDRYEGGYVALVLSAIMSTERRIIRDYDLRSEYGNSPSVYSAFLYELTLAPGTNTIVIKQRIWASCDMVDESCVYRFGFDEERYLSGSVPVEIVLTTQRTVSSCTFAMTGDKLLFDATKHLLEIDTLADESVGSSGRKPVVQAVPTI